MKKFKGNSEQSNDAVPRPGASATDIDALPLEMLSHVLGFLTLSEQLKLATVSRRWQQAADSCLARCRHFSKDLIPGMNHVTDRKLEKILSRLPGLRRLNHISGTDLDVDVISRHCPQLVETNLYIFRVNVSSLERLCRSCPKLAVLSLPESCDNACIETVLRGLSELRSLDMFLSNVTGRCFSLLPPSLQRLELNGDWNLHPAEIDRVARCPALTELDISGLYRLPLSGDLVKLLDACPRLERLNAKDLLIEDAFLEQLPEKTPAIRHLNLASCADLTEVGLKSLGRLKELRSLDLFDTHTTDPVLEQLQGAFNLTKLYIGPDMYHSHEFSIEALARLVVSCPALRLVIPSVMVDARNLVECLIGQLSPDRDVTVEGDADTLYSMEGRLPEHGPLRLAEYTYED